MRYNKSCVQRHTLVTQRSLASLVKVLELFICLLPLYSQHTHTHRCQRLHAFAYVHMCSVVGVLGVLRLSACGQQVGVEISCFCGISKGNSFCYCLDDYAHLHHITHNHTGSLAFTRLCVRVCALSLKLCRRSSVS